MRFCFFISGVLGRGGKMLGSVICPKVRSYIPIGERRYM